MADIGLNPMKTALTILCLTLVGCQQASPPWDTIAFVLGDTINAPKKTDSDQTQGANNQPKHPLE